MSVVLKASAYAVRPAPEVFIVPPAASARITFFDTPTLAAIISNGVCISKTFDIVSLPRLRAVISNPLFLATVNVFASVVLMVS